MKKIIQREPISQLSKSTDMKNLQPEKDMAKSEFIENYLNMNRIFKNENDGTEHTWGIAEEGINKSERKKPIKYWLTNKESEGLKVLQEETGITISSLIRVKIKDTLKCFFKSKKENDSLNYPDVYKIDEINKWYGHFIHNEILYTTDLLDDDFEVHLLLNMKRKELGLAKNRKMVKQVVKL